MVEVDFNSEEALYIQLRNQIIIGIARNRIMPGDVLPSVRQLAGEIGINMHTVNKAYSVLRQEGFIKLDRRRGAVIAVEEDRARMLAEIRHEMSVLLAAAACKNITREEIHELVDQIFNAFPCSCGRGKDEGQQSRQQEEV